MLTTKLDSSSMAKTPDGKPTPLAAINTNVPTVLAKGRLQRVAIFIRKLNLVMAGMYTGVGCSGTPHSHHTYEENTDRKSGKLTKTADKP